MSRKAQMKIVHVGKFYFPHRGGMESHLQALCECLPSVVNTTIVVANNTAASHIETINGITVARAAVFGQVLSVPFAPGIIPLVRSLHPDLLHLHVPNPIGTIACLLKTGVPLVISYHSDTVRQRVTRRMFEPLMQSALDRAGAIICASEKYLVTSRSLDQHRKKCHIVPYGIDVRKFEHRDLISIEELRNRFGRPLIIAVGRLVGYKGFEYLVRAMVMVRANLIIIGTGPLRSSLANLAADLGVSARVKFIGDVEDPTPFYHASDVFVLPSITRAEAFGIVQLEAMTCGLPVVNTTLDSGVTFASPGGETGLTVPPRDVVALANALRCLLEDDKLRRRLGDQARIRVNSFFTVSQMAATTHSIYRSLLEQSHTSGEQKHL